jgi:hypothetical protein
MLASALWRIGAGVQVSRYRRIRRTRRDILVTASALVLIVIWGCVWLLDSTPFIFYPYPRFKPPAFDLLLAAPLLLLAAPIVAQKLFPHD